MPLNQWTAFVATVAVLVSIPGPSQVLMVSSTLSNGLHRSVATAAGDLSANLLQILAAGAGLGAVVVASETAFAWVKWCGVAYLLWLGATRIVRGTGGTTGPSRRRGTRPWRALWRDGFFTSAANPKAILFFAALFPQFIDPEGAFWTQVGILGVTYLLLDGTCLALYGTASSRLARCMEGARVGRTMDRVAGGLMIAAGALLSAKHAIR